MEKANAKPERIRTTQTAQIGRAQSGTAQMATALRRKSDLRILMPTPSNGVTNMCTAQTARALWEIGMRTPIDTAEIGSYV